MQRTILQILIILASISSIAQDCQDSRIESFLNDPDTTGTNMRESPNGKIIYVVKNDYNWEIIETFEILDARNNWLYVVTTDNGNNPEKRGWIFGGLISLSTRNYEGQAINLYQKPNKKSSVKDVLNEEKTVQVFEVCGQWAYVKYIDEYGNSIEGWLEPEMQCGSPYTTCN